MPQYLSKVEISAAIRQASTPEELDAVFAANNVFITNDTHLKDAHFKKAIELKQAAPKDRVPTLSEGWEGGHTETSF